MLPRRAARKRSGSAQRAEGDGIGSRSRQCAQHLDRIRARRGHEHLRSRRPRAQGSRRPPVRVVHGRDARPARRVHVRPEPAASSTSSARPASCAGSIRLRAATVCGTHHRGERRRRAGRPRRRAAPPVAACRSSTCTSRARRRAATCSNQLLRLRIRDGRGGRARGAAELSDRIARQPQRRAASRSVPTASSTS